MMYPRWALFISGRGSTMQSALDLCSECNIRVVFSSKVSALGIKKAKRYGVEVVVLPKIIDWGSVILELHRRKISNIFLLGFMKVIPESFLTQWGTRIFNVHPSLLPRFKGAKAIEDSFHSNEDMGVTIHHVVAEIDSGNQILQKKINRELSENISILSRKISILEQQMIRKVLLDLKGVQIGA